jgi:hypothetical protein
VNRSGGFLGNGAGSASGKQVGKDLSGKPKPSGGAGPKNSTGSHTGGSSGTGKRASAGSRASKGGAGRGSAGRSAGADGTDSGTSSTGGRSTGRDKTRTTTDKAPSKKEPSSSGGSSKDSPGSGKTADGSSKAAGGKNATDGAKGAGSGGGKDGSRGAQGTPGADGKTGKAPAAGSTGKNTPDQPKTDPKDTAKSDPKDTKPDSTDAGKATGAAGKNPAGQKDDKTSDSPQPKKPGQEDDRANADGQTKNTNPALDSAAGGDPSLRESREAGYRDGARAARVVAHVEAWRDGAIDGWTDSRQAAAREKTLLDQAHAHRKQQRTGDQPVTASSLDHHTPPTATPIPVTGVDATHVYLGDGAARPSMRRGEIRTLKQYERQLAEKRDTLTRITEVTKALKEHVQDTAKTIQDKAEQARSVQGGDKLIGELAKAAEAAQKQATAAEELHTKALRASEYCASVLANIQTRYDGIYTAIVNSPLTQPAELSFYRDAA